MSENATNEVLAKQLRQLNRRLAGLTSLVLILSCAAIVGWQHPAPTSIQVRSLELVDDEGLVRARLNTRNHSTNLFLYDASGKLAVEITAPGNGGMVALRDFEARERARLFGFGPSAGLMIWDKSGNLKHMTAPE